MTFKYEVKGVLIGSLVQTGSGIKVDSHMSSAYIGKPEKKKLKTVLLPIPTVPTRKECNGCQSSISGGLGLFKGIIVMYTLENPKESVSTRATFFIKYLLLP